MLIQSLVEESSYIKSSTIFFYYYFFFFTPVSSQLSSFHKLKLRGQIQQCLLPKATHCITPSCTCYSASFLQSSSVLW